MDQHLEIEAKYDVSAELDLPDLTVGTVSQVREPPGPRTQFSN